MDAMLINVIGGIIAALVLGLVVIFRKRIPRTYKAIKLIWILKRKYLTHFRRRRYGRTKFIRRLQYYFRDHDPTSRVATQLTFSFFAEQDFELEEFKGFLIPPLNREGVRTDGDDLEHLRSDITHEWKEYFQNIGRKAERRVEKTGLSCGQRIIFFDRFLLDFFISERASLLKYGRINKEQKDRLTVNAGVPESSQLVRYAIRSAYATARIHELNRGYSTPNGAGQSPIVTYYCDKGHVKSAVYCDFGLYGITGRTFAYMPIYLRGLDKRLVGERVFIDNSSPQRARIDEFRESFNDLWEECEKQKHAEMKHRDSGEDIKLSDIEAYCFSYEFFEDTYIHNVNKIFKEEFHWDPVRDKALPS